MAGVLEISSRHLNRLRAHGRGGNREFPKGPGGRGDRVSGAVAELEALPNEFSIDTPGGGGEPDQCGRRNLSLNGRARLGADWTVRGSMSDRGLPGTSVNPTPNARGRDRSLLIGARPEPGHGSASYSSGLIPGLKTRRLARIHNIRQSHLGLGWHSRLGPVVP